MKPLNDDFSFDQLTENERTAVNNAFCGTPHKDTFAVGTRFYRFITPKKGERAPLLGNEILGGKWWFSETTRSQLSRLAYNQRTSLANSARDRLFITREFNREMEYLCRIIVTLPICGWVGVARTNPQDKGNVCLAGGAEQVYLPSLGVHPGGVYSDAVKLDMWAYLDDAL